MGPMLYEATPWATKPPTGLKGDKGSPGERGRQWQHWAHTIGVECASSLWNSHESFPACAFNSRGTEVPQGSCSDRQRGKHPWQHSSRAPSPPQPVHGAGCLSSSSPTWLHLFLPCQGTSCPEEWAQTMAGTSHYLCKVPGLYNHPCQGWGPAHPTSPLP